MINISIIAELFQTLHERVAICYVYTIVTLFVYNVVGFRIITLKPYNKYFNFHYFFILYDGNMHGVVTW